MGIQAEQQQKTHGKTTKGNENKDKQQAKNTKLLSPKASERKRQKCHAAETLHLQHFESSACMDSKPISNSTKKMDNEKRTSEKRTFPKENNGLLHFITS